MSKDYFDGYPPKEQRELELLTSFPPTVTWKSDPQDSEEQISSRIVKKSPNENEWDFVINYKDNKNNNELEKLHFTIKKVGEEEWSSEIISATKLYSEIKNNMNDLLENFSFSTYGTQATFTAKYSANYNKEIVAEGKKKFEEESKKDRRLGM